MPLDEDILRWLEKLAGLTGAGLIFSSYKEGARRFATSQVEEFCVEGFSWGSAEI